MHDGTMGQPAWLTPWFGFVRKVTYVGVTAWSLLIWITAEGFGRTRPGEIATDTGTAIIYAVVFLSLLAVDRCSGTRAYSLDAVIERRLPWWQRIAEVGG